MSRDPGFRDVLAAEWAKILTVRSTYWTIFASLAVSVGLSFLIALAYISSWDDMTPRERLAFDPAAYGMTGTNIGVLVLAVLGVLVITAEYATGLIRTSLTAVPDRRRFFVAKGLVLTAVAFVVGQASAFASFLLSQLLFAAKDLDASLGDPGVLRAVFGAGVYLTLVTVLAYGIGGLLRHTAGGITVVVGVMFVLPIIANFLPDSWGSSVRRYIPSSAGSAISMVRQSEMFPSPGTGFAVFCGYLALVLVPAFVLFQRRDA